MSRESKRQRRKPSFLNYGNLEQRRLRAGLSCEADPVVFLASPEESVPVWSLTEESREFRTDDQDRGDHGMSLSYDAETQQLTVNSSNARPLIFAINRSYAFSEDGIDYSNQTHSLMIRDQTNLGYSRYEVYGIINGLEDGVIKRIVIRGQEGNDYVRFTTNFHSESSSEEIPEISVSFYGRDGDDALSFRAAEGNDYWYRDFESTPESFAYLNISASGGNGDDYLEGHWVRGEDGNDKLRNPANRRDLPLEQYGAMVLPFRESWFDGGAGDDDILGFGTLLGRSGDDLLQGKGTMDGGSGDDVLRSRQFISYDWDKYYENFPGDVEDFVIFHDEGNTMKGGDGNDKIFGTPGADQIFGDSGNDALFGGLGDDEIRGGSGQDVIFGNSPAAWSLYEAVTEHHVAPGLYYAKNWYSTLRSPWDPATPRDMITYGSPGLEIDIDHREDRSDFHANHGGVFGVKKEVQSWVTRFRRPGSRDIETKTHFQLEFTRTDNDKIYGDTGNDQIFGNWGNDRIEGGNGDDRINGGSGNDQIYGESTNVSSGYGNDTILGGFDHDRIFGGVGRDVLRGNQGNDKLWGGFGSDRVYGDSGNDYIAGGNYSNWLTASRWNYDNEPDYLFGGSGSDTFVQTLKEQRQRYWFFGWRYRTRTVSEDLIADFGSGDRLIFSNVRPR